MVIIEAKRLPNVYNFLEGRFISKLGLHVIKNDNSAVFGSHKDLEELTFSINNKHILPLRSMTKSHDFVIYL